MEKHGISLDGKRIELLGNISNAKYGCSEKAKKKAKVILLRFDGKTIKEIMKETHLCKRTVINYINGYKQNELWYIHQNYYRKSVLKGNQNILDEFKNEPPSSYKEASERIKKLFNITISESATRRFLNKKNIYTKRSKKDSF